MISNELNERILDAICEEKNISREMIFTGTRRRMYVEPRQIYQYILVKYYRVTTLYLERYGDGWTHGNLNYSMKNVDAQLVTDSMYRKSFERIMSKIRGNITCPHCGAIIETK